MWSFIATLKGQEGLNRISLLTRKGKTVVLRRHHVNCYGISVEQMTPDMFVSLWLITEYYISLGSPPTGICDSGFPVKLFQKLSVCTKLDIYRVFLINIVNTTDITNGVGTEFIHVCCLILSFLCSVLWKILFVYLGFFFSIF